MHRTTIGFVLTHTVTCSRQSTQHGAWVLSHALFTYGGYTLRSEIEAPLITREVLPETYFFVGDYGS
jgi:hypothetical protein